VWPFMTIVYLNAAAINGRVSVAFHDNCLLKCSCYKWTGSIIRNERDGPDRNSQDILSVTSAALEGHQGQCFHSIIRVVVVAVASSQTMKGLQIKLT
jgi:hypothetical protein